MRNIYVTSGEMVNIRVVPEGDDPTAKNWLDCLYYRSGEYLTTFNIDSIEIKDARLTVVRNGYPLNSCSVVYQGKVK